MGKYLEVVQSAVIITLPRAENPETVIGILGGGGGNNIYVS